MNAAIITVVSFVVRSFLHRTGVVSDGEDERQRVEMVERPDNQCALYVRKNKR